MDFEVYTIDDALKIDIDDFHIGFTLDGIEDILSKLKENQSLDFDIINEFTNITLINYWSHKHNIDETINEEIIKDILKEFDKDEIKRLYDNIKEVVDEFRGV